jgi:transcriptional regulatory protein RtcR
MKKKIVIGFAGIQLDGGRDTERWNKWRPSVSITQREDVLIDRFELLFNGDHRRLVGRIVDDIALTSPSTKVTAHCLPIVDAWDLEDVYSALLAFSKEYKFNTDEEEYWIHMTTGSHIVQICMFLLTKAGYFPGSLLQTSPPKREGDVGGFQLIDLDLSKYDKLAEIFQSEKRLDTDFLKFGLVTRNRQYNDMISEIERVAIRSRKSVLLTGQSGTGKTSLARRIYALKRERGQIAGKMVEVNCATLIKDSAGSTLFGHTKGAFTGAQSDRVGLLRSANRGMLFLDEIGELGLDEQAMLLKALEDKRFHPLGGDAEVESDFQLIAGTNRDLAKEVEAGRFRGDLFARINTWCYELPSVAERSEDIEPSVDYILAQQCAESGELVRFNKEARAKYLGFATSDEASWPGNFRDLSASVDRMATMADGGRITVENVDREIKCLRSRQGSRTKLSGGGESPVALPKEVGDLDAFDEFQLKLVVETCKKSRSLSDAGRKLFAVSRANKANPNDADRLKKYLAKFGLTWEFIVN